MSIPIRGRQRRATASAAVAGVHRHGGRSGALVVGLLDGTGPSRAGPPLDRSPSLRLDEDPRGTPACSHVAGPPRGTRQRTASCSVARSAGWAAANWLLDAAALWVFLRAFGLSDRTSGRVARGRLRPRRTCSPVVPIMPGGLGVVDAALHASATRRPSACRPDGRPRSASPACRHRVELVCPTVTGRRPLRHRWRGGPCSIQRRQPTRSASATLAAGQPTRPARAHSDFAARFGSRPSHPGAPSTGSMVRPSQQRRPGEQSERQPPLFYDDWLETDRPKSDRLTSGAMTATSARSAGTSRTSRPATSCGTGRARRSPSTTTTCSA